ncbi:hypothetical protein Hamer_G017623 [Homarus americanus]|uniref:CXC domain-containing protein n=1 Tax=Homarus americanus TaxID=6706 RepID=A0A8J5JF07_HOMAM|nr:hypothetical protein Hamer_G017623 [Homarus americanus]
MAALRMAGSWLQGSGWTETLVQVDVDSPGIANSFLKAAHVTRTRRGHQITAATLNILQHKAYGKYTEDAQSDGHEPIEFGVWCQQRAECCPQFQYWATTLNLELKRLEDKSKPIGDTIKLYKLTLFSSMKSKTPTRSKQQLAFAKDDCGLFPRLYIACQTREGDLDEFLKHENWAYPPALSSNGKLRFSKKADLLTPLEQLADKITDAPSVTSTILDGPAVVEMLKPGGSRTFKEYSTAVFIPYIESQLEHRSRLDLLVVKESKQLVVTDKKQVLTVPPRNNTANLAPCNHEEADTRMMVHAADALECGKNQRYITAHQIAKALGPEKSRALPVFHAITGCDTVPVFAGHSKNAAWATWNAFPEVTTAFLSLASTSSELPGGVLSTLERFIVLFYDRTSTCCDVNVLRKKLCSRQSRSLEDLPPTRAALEQHIKRAAYQAGHIWGQAAIAFVSLPSPCDWGWMKSGDELEPCHKLISCGCRKHCDGKCRCKKAALKCTGLCACEGGC